jgi:hypothetical protein
VRYVGSIVLVGAAALFGILGGTAYRAGLLSWPWSDLVSKDFVLGAVPLAIALPAATVTRMRDANTVDFNTTPGRRIERRLSLTLAARLPDAAYAHTKRLRNGGVVAYSVSTEAGGGSGGREAHLSGVLEMPGLMLQVTCSDQSEDAPQPDWCLPLLDHLAIVRQPK